MYGNTTRSRMHPTHNGIRAMFPYIYGDIHYRSCSVKLRIRYSVDVRDFGTVCAGALSCWNMKTSPDIRRISGNICCFFRSDELFDEFAGHSPGWVQDLVLIFSGLRNVVIRCMACDINTIQDLVLSQENAPKLTEQLVRSKEKLERVVEQWVE